MIRTAMFRSTLLASLLAAPMLAAPLPAAAFVSIGISVGLAPPPLPVYAQPFAPGPGYIWTPGYWAWDPAYGYYWVPGAWVLPPAIGLLWTPGWWGWDTGYYRWHAGYWGPRVGFYGGINYGFGYFGAGYVGGYWRGRDFFYNRAVNNVNVTNIHNVYVNKTVVNNYQNGAATRVSYNGGRGGLTVRPTSTQLAMANERHFDPTPAQTRQRELAVKNPTQRFSVNRGRPGVMATAQLGSISPPRAARNETMTAPRAAKPTAAAQASPSMARPSDGFVHAPRTATGTTPRSTSVTMAPRATSQVAATRASPSTARPSDGFVHAPRMATGTTPRAATETASRTAPMPTLREAPTRQPSDGFVRAPRTTPAAPSRSEAVPPRGQPMPPRTQAMSPRNEGMPPTASYGRQAVPPPMPQYEARPSTPQYGPAPQEHGDSHKPSPKQDRRDNGGH